MIRLPISRFAFMAAAVVVLAGTPPVWNASVGKSGKSTAPAATQSPPATQPVAANDLTTGSRGMVASAHPLRNGTA